MRMTERLELVANARLSAVMERRRSEGGGIVGAAAAKVVLWALVNRSDQDGRCFPGIDLIARESDVPARTVQRVLAVLAEEGVVSVTVRRSEPGVAKRQSTNSYRVDWTALAECADGGPRTRATVACDPEANTRQGGAGSGATVAHEHAPPATGTRATSDRNTRHGAHRSKEEPPSEPTMNHPPTPQGGDGGGEGEVVCEEQTRQAEAILREYPQTSGDRWLDDVDAAVRAIRFESGQREGATPEEIREAAAAVRRLGGTNPVWPRTWLRERRYMAHVMRRRKANPSPESPRPKALEVLDKAAAEIGEETKAIEQVLDGVPPDRVDELVARAIASEPNDLIREWLLDLESPESNRLVRSLMAAIVGAEKGEAA